MMNIEFYGSISAGLQILLCRRPISCRLNATPGHFFCLIIILVLLNLGLPACANDTPESLPAVSGFLQDGLRVIPIPPSTADLSLTVYRGDYIKFQQDSSLGSPLLSIPDLGIRKVLPLDFQSAPFIKIKNTGTFEFSIGLITGSLTVIPFQQECYRELSTGQSVALIKTDSPLILDVRTRQEYAAGHLLGAVHIPLHQLQTRYSELAEFRDKPVLLYCATGNRSTVASKILIDKGFERIDNMRHGIVDWIRKKNPVVR